MVFPFLDTENSSTSVIEKEFPNFKMQFIKQYLFICAETLKFSDILNDSVSTVFSPADV
jgi:hypothetical protein